MSLKIDPKTTGFIPRQGLEESIAEARQAQAEQLQTQGPPAPELRPRPKPASPENITRPVPTKAKLELAPFIERAQALAKSVRKAGPEQLTAAQQALVAAASYAMRRSKGSRQHAIDLLEAVQEHVPEVAAEAKRLRHVLLAEAYLQENDAASTLRAMRALVGMLDEEVELDDDPADEAPMPDRQTLTATEIECIGRATLAHAFVQLVLHFPASLADLELSPDEALQQAMRLAEEAIALSPHLPDGHCALGRVLLCHDDAEAVADAVAILQHALGLDPNHDPAEVGLAVAMWRQGLRAQAQDTVNRVLLRGNALPQPLLLRGLLLLEDGQPAQARRDIERAVALAPKSGLLRLDAAAAAAAAGDHEGAENHRREAMALLGDAYDAWAKATGL
jgi:tetratricopeptide (TPR) repeat protein